MNTDILAGKWQQIRGQAKQRWGKLTDSDLEKANGKADELAGLLKEKYGYTTEKAHQKSIASSKSTTGSGQQLVMGRPEQSTYPGG